MEYQETKDSAIPAATTPEARSMSTGAAGSCPTCLAGASPVGQSPSFVYALGRIEPRFPRLSVEKEFAQVTGRSNTSSLTDRQALHTVLSKPENRYLIRQLCWVLTIEGLETYLLTPRDPNDRTLLVESLRPSPRLTDLDVVIGIRGPLAPPDMCNGLQVPIVAFDQIYSFDREALLSAIPKPEKMGSKEFAPAAEELFDRIIQIADNAGASDAHRALNYCAVRYPAIYAKVAEEFAENSSLTEIGVVASPLTATRKVVHIVFSFTNRTTDVTEKYFARVDVTEEFPFLVTKLSPYYDR
jgi:hypothetical protein